MAVSDNPNVQDPKHDSTPEGGSDQTGNGDPNTDADTITLSKKDYDELKFNVGKYSKSSREYKRELEELRKKSQPQPPKAEPLDDPEDDDDDPADSGAGKLADVKTIERSWRRRVEKRDARITELEAALAAANEAAEAEKLEFMFDKLLDELVSDPKVDPRQKAKVKKLIRDAMEVNKEDDRYKIYPKDGGYDPKRWLEDWLEEEDNEVFKINDRKAGAGHAGDPDGAGKSGKMTPQTFAALSPKERIKFLQENPELQKELAGGMMTKR